MTTFRKAVRAAYKVQRAEGHRPSQALAIAKSDARYCNGSNKRNMMPSRYAAYDGVEITELPNGWKIKVEFRHDGDSGPPWSECDGMGVIETSTHRPGEYDEYDDWIINSDRGWYRYFDWKATLPIAIRDGWNTPPYHMHHDKKAQAMAAMRSTCEYLRRWCNDGWWYVGMIVTLLDEDSNEIEEDSCWGFESDSTDYLTSEARSWAAHMIVKARKDLREKRYWEERDVVTA